MALPRLAAAAITAAALVAMWPVWSTAAPVTPGATVSAAVVERTAPDVWRVDVRWSATCEGVADGKSAGYGGALYLVDVDTAERRYLVGVVTASGVHDTRVAAIEREQHLRPELTITCYETFPQIGAGYDITVTGDPVTIPARLARRSGGGGGGGAGAAGGGRDPTGPLRAGGCRVALLGTNGPDRLTGGDAGEVAVGFGSADRLRGEGGHDCLIGGPGADRLTGGEGADRLTGGPGRDALIGGPGVNAYDAGGGNDVVRARNGTAEIVRCGSGRDRAYVDRRDRTRGCELSLVAGGR